MSLQSNPNCFTKFDLLGNPITYSVNGKNKVYLPFGGFLTILLILTFLSLISVFVIPFYQRLEPRVVYQNIKINNPSSWNLYFNEFILGLKIDVDDYTMNHFLQNVILDLNYITQQEINNYTIVSKTNLSTIYSTQEDFKNNTLFFENHMKESIKIQYQEDMDLKGASISNNYSFIQIQLRLKNETENSTFLQNLLSAKKKKIKIFYSDLSLNLDNYDIPAKNFTSFFEDDIEIDSKKKVIMEFGINNITTDFGYFLDKTIETKLGIMHFSTSIISSTRKDSTLFDFTIRMSKYAPIYYRSYMKIPELLANVGGILSIVRMSVQIINLFVGKYFLNFAVMDKLLEFDRDFMENSIIKREFGFEPLTFQKNVDTNLLFEASPNNEIHNHRKKQFTDNGSRVSIGTKSMNCRTHQKDPKLKISDNIENKSISVRIENKTKDDLSRNTNIYKEYRKKPKLPNTPFFHSKDICTFLFLRMCRNQYNIRKFKLYQKALEIIKYYTDYLWVVRKSMEVDALKYLILTNDQIRLYKLMKRPFICLNYPKMNSNSFHLNEVFKDFSDSFLHSKSDIEQMSPNEKNKCSTIYKRFEKKENLTAIDLKILHSIGDNYLLLK